MARYAKVSKKLNGNTLALALQGTKEEIENSYNLLFNHAAINDSELQFDSDSFALVWTTPEKLERGLTSIWFHRLMSSPKQLKKFKGIKGGFYNYANRLAIWHISRIRQEQFSIRELTEHEDFSWVEAYMRRIKREEEKVLLACMEAEA